MRVQGQELVGGHSQRITLLRSDGSSVSMRAAPLSLGFHRRLRVWGLVAPQPPVRVARDPSGLPLRDAQGQAVTLRDECDPAYAADLETYHQRVAVLAIAESLQADPDVEFDAKAPAGEHGPAAWMAYADELFAELERSGFTAGDLTQLCGTICRMSRLLDEHLRETRGNFSSARPVATG